MFENLCVFEDTIEVVLCESKGRQFFSFIINHKHGFFISWHFLCIIPESMNRLSYGSECSIEFLEMSTEFVIEE